MRVLSLDPGEQTGYAVGTILDHRLVVESSGYAPWKVVALQAFDSILAGKYDAVVYEAWRLRRSSALALVGSDMQSSQCIGCLKLACWISQRNGNPVELRHQEPAIKRVIDSMMGGTKYLPPSDGAEHARDAVRHLYYFAIHEKEVRP